MITFVRTMKKISPKTSSANIIPWYSSLKFIIVMRFMIIDVWIYVLHVWIKVCAGGFAVVE